MLRTAVRWNSFRKPHSCHPADGHQCQLDRCEKSDKWDLMDLGLLLNLFTKQLSWQTTSQSCSSCPCKYGLSNLLRIARNPLEFLLCCNPQHPVWFWQHDLRLWSLSQVLSCRKLTALLKFEGQLRSYYFVFWWFCPLLWTTLWFEAPCRVLWMCHYSSAISDSPSFRPFQRNSQYFYEAVASWLSRSSYWWNWSFGS